MIKIDYDQCIKNQVSWAKHLTLAFMAYDDFGYDGAIDHQRIAQQAVERAKALARLNRHGA